MQLVPTEGEMPQQWIRNAENHTLEMVGDFSGSYPISEFLRMLELKGTGLRKHLVEPPHVSR